MARHIFTRAPRYALRSIAAGLVAGCLVAMVVAILLALLQHFDPPVAAPKARCERPLNVGQHKFLIVVVDGRVVLNCRRGV